LEWIHLTNCCTRKNCSLRSQFSGEQGVTANNHEDRIVEPQWCFKEENQRDRFFLMQMYCSYKNEKTRANQRYNTANGLANTCGLVLPRIRKDNPEVLLLSERIFEVAKVPKRD